MSHDTPRRPTQAPTDLILPLVPTELPGPRLGAGARVGRNLGEGIAIWLISVLLEQ